MAAKAKVNIFQGENQLWYYNVQASNGEIATQSEGYASKSNAKRAVDDLKRIIGELDVEETESETREGNEDG
jgi:uncharacterized protein YegP (UPF0339 family)